jgi:hypothetical protein
MRTRLPSRLLTGAIILVALMAVGSGPAAAQQAPAAQPAPGERNQVIVTMVRTRDLVTPAERQAYRQAMGAARTVAERQKVREQMMERVGRRAAEHGVVMIIDAPMVRPELRSSAESRHPTQTRPLEVTVRHPPPRAP